MLAEFSERFPEVMLPLIHERDVYLAWSLSRSKAVRAMLGAGKDVHPSATP